MVDIAPIRGNGTAFGVVFVPEDVHDEFFRDLAESDPDVHYKTAGAKFDLQSQAAKSYIDSSCSLARHDGVPGSYLYILYDHEILLVNFNHLDYDLIPLDQVWSREVDRIQIDKNTMTLLGSMV